MRIAQVSPLEESVPPRTYGGTERIISYLTEELVRQGHDVTLFASGDSQSSARLVSGCPQALRFDKDCQDKLALQIVQLKSVMDRRHDFDLIHFHTDYIHFPFASSFEKPTVTTLHGRQDIRELKSVYSAFDKNPVVSISYEQRKPLPMARWVGTVHHGLPEELFTFQPQPGQYLAFLGRISPEKRVDRAIEIAKACHIPLKIAAKVDGVDRLYFDQEIRHLLDHPLIEFIGEISQAEKSDFLGGALALLFPIDWPEPFGLVMIEAMACGTPVVAFRHGSVSEVVQHGVSGFIVDSMPEAIQVVQHIDKLSRRRCRQEYLDRFTADRMTRNYVSLYEKLIDETLHGTIIPFSSRLGSPRAQYL